MVMKIEIPAQLDKLKQIMILNNSRLRKNACVCVYLFVTAGYGQGDSGK